jgi:hypothetical protein
MAGEMVGSHPHGRAVSVVAAAAAIAACLLALVAGPAAAQRKASHKGWPVINGALLINKFDGSRPLDARPGHDPFGGTDPSYSCDADHRYQGCFVQAGACPRAVVHDWLCAAPPVMPENTRRHNELLGAHGSDTIHAGPNGDVIWGDYKPGGPWRQTDRIWGGAGRDFIYTSHGRNVVHTGGGRDVVHAHYGRGTIYCDSTTVLIYLSHRSKRHYHLRGCKRGHGHITFRAAGTQPG